MDARPPYRHIRIQGIRGDAPTHVVESAIGKILAKSKEEIEFTITIVPACYMQDGSEVLFDSQVGIAKFPYQLPNFLSTLATDQIGTATCQIELGDGEAYVCDAHWFGLTQLYGVATDDTRLKREITADVVAVTGLNGKPFDSWRGHDRHGRMWLKDFFATDFPNFRTMIYGYNTKWESMSIGETEDFVYALCKDIRKARTKEIRTADARSRLKCPNRPLIFIGHSFGATVIARTLVYCHTNPQDTFLSSILKSTRAVMFFGAPHKGMDIKDLIDMAREKSAEHRTALLQSLGVDSVDELAAEMSKFVNVVNQTGLLVFTFYELELSRRMKQQEDDSSKFARKGEHFNFVDKSSLLGLGLPSTLERKIPVNASHSTMVKFSARTDETYQDVVLAMRDVEKLIKSSSSVIPSDPMMHEAEHGARQHNTHDMAPATEYPSEYVVEALKNLKNTVLLPKLFPKGSLTLGQLLPNPLLPALSPFIPAALPESNETVRAPPEEPYTALVPLAKTGRFKTSLTSLLWGDSGNSSADRLLIEAKSMQYEALNNPDLHFRRLCEDEMARVWIQDMAVHKKEFFLVTGLQHLTDATWKTLATNDGNVGGEARNTWYPLGGLGGNERSARIGIAGATADGTFGIQVRKVQCRIRTKAEQQLQRQQQKNQEQAMLPALLTEDIRWYYSHEKKKGPTEDLERELVVGLENFATPSELETLLEDEEKHDDMDNDD